MRKETRIDHLDTPAVLIDLERVGHNLLRWQQHCDRHGLANRSHIKTHKLVRFARRQIELGAVGICCQKLGEAEVMADGGIDDIFVPYNLVGRAKLARAVALARRIRLAVGCDSAEVAKGLSAAFSAAGLEIEVRIECDTGARRCGVADPESALALARLVDRLPGLRFGGLFTYPPPGATAAVATFFARCRELFSTAGLPLPLLSSGGTPDMWRAQEAVGVGEHRAGTYIYYDCMQIAAGAARLEDCALTVLTTVVSRPAPDRCILDAGSKTLSADRSPGHHGLVLEYPRARIVRLSEEHAHVDLSDSPERPRIGERVRVVPAHVCLVSNLADRVFGTVGDEVEWDSAVDARGRVV
ncbi:D-threonine aldolase [bacterium HR40]|nr:D-threonine aldolase [bacterium HR40]